MRMFSRVVLAISHKFSNKQCGCVSDTTVTGKNLLSLSSSRRAPHGRAGALSPPVSRERGAAAAAEGALRWGMARAGTALRLRFPPALARPASPGPADSPPLPSSPLFI